MSDQEARARQAQKFLFDRNNFDDGAQTEPDKPVKTIFSLQEVEDERAQARAEGMREGLAQAAASREEKIAAITRTMGANLSSLLTAEGARAALYESETLALARAIFDKLFPALNARHGVEEVMAVVGAVLESQRAQPEILIEVHPEYEADIRQYVESLTARMHGGPSCRVEGSDALGPGDCRMGWRDGGATRDVTGLAVQIAAQMEQALADHPALRDNGQDANGAAEKNPARKLRGTAKKGDET